MLHELNQLKPTIQWNQMLEQGNELYTSAIIKETDLILDQYIQQLMKLHQPTESEIMQCVKNIVLALNSLNESYCFIETIEREELCDFIYLTAERVGLQSNEDITEQWRDW